MKAPLNPVTLLHRILFSTLFLMVVLILEISLVFSWQSASRGLEAVDRIMLEMKESSPGGIEAVARSRDRSPLGKPQFPPRNIFIKQETSSKLTAIYMETAVIDGQSVQVGDRVGQGVVREIGDSSVVILEGKEQRPVRLEMFARSPSEPIPPSGRHSTPGHPGNSIPGNSIHRPAMVEAESPLASPGQPSIPEQVQEDEPTLGIKPDRPPSRFSSRVPLVRETPKPELPDSKSPTMAEAPMAQSNLQKVEGEETLSTPTDWPRPRENGLGSMMEPSLTPAMQKMTAQEHARQK
ncbi:MAG: hypothetical protein ACE15F_14290 [bacterium]